AGWCRSSRGRQRCIRLVRARRSSSTLGVVAATLREEADNRWPQFQQIPRRPRSVSLSPFSRSLGTLRPFRVAPRRSVTSRERTRPPGFVRVSRPKSRDSPRWMCRRSPRSRAPRQVLMSVGFLSDAHGNVEAFELGHRVLRRFGADTIYFLGDAVGYLPGPSVVEAVLAEGIPSIRGNHEAMLLAAGSTIPHDDVYQLRSTAAAMAPALLESVARWPVSRELWLGS